MSARKWFFWLCVFAIGSIYAIGWAADPAVPAGYTHIRTEQGISEYRLDSNGLTVLLMPDHSVPVVSVIVTYHVGSRNESYGTTGATHLLEHLMFKGTAAHNKEAGNGFDQTLERTGAITNATTSQDRTNYFETVGTQDLPLAIEIEADRIRNLRLREEDRRPEMTVVRNEYERGENSPAEALEKEIWATAFLAHPYHHSTIGWKSDFEKVPIEKLRAFYDTFYWPNNATVTISGDADPAVALKLIKQFYGSIPKSPHPIPQVYTEEPKQTGPRRVVVKRPGELGIVTIAHKMPYAKSADYAALDVLSEILADGRNSRMYEALTDKNLTTNVDASPAFNHDPSLFLISAQLASGADHADVEKKMLDELAKVQTDGVTEQEVAAAIAKLTANTAFSRDGPLARGMAISECIAAGDWRLYFNLDQAIRKVTPADVKRVAKQYFTEDQRVTGWFIPLNEADSAAAAAAGESASNETDHSELKQAASADDSQAKSKPSSKSNTPTNASVNSSPKSSGSSPVMAPVEVAAAKIAPRIARKNIAGMDVLICPTGVKDVVTITGSFPAYDPADPLAGELVAAMLERGTAQHDARAIASLLDEMGAQIQISASAGSIKFAARSLKKDSQRVIALLAEQLKSPTFPSDEFEKLIKLSISEAEQQRESTDAQASIAFHRAVYPAGNPLHSLTTDETIDKLKTQTVENLKKFHHEWFGPKECTLVAVGDVEPEAIEKQLAKSFEGWQGGHDLPKFPKVEPLKKASQSIVAVPGKESVTVMIGEPTGLIRTDADYLPLSVGSSVLGHGFTSRLVGIVRDTEGLTYGIAAGLSGQEKLDRAWVIQATFAPSLLKQGLISTRRELASWQRNGITPAELEYRKSALAGEHRVGMATSSGLAEMILDTICAGLDLSWIDNYPKDVAALSVDQVNSTIRRYVDPSKMMTIEAGTIPQATGHAN